MPMYYNHSTYLPSFQSFMQGSYCHSREGHLLRTNSMRTRYLTMMMLGKELLKGIWMDSESHGRYASIPFSPPLVLFHTSSYLFIAGLWIAAVQQGLWDLLPVRLALSDLGLLAGGALVSAWCCVGFVSQTLCMAISWFCALFLYFCHFNTKDDAMSLPFLQLLTLPTGQLLNFPFSFLCVCVVFGFCCFVAFLLCFFVHFDGLFLTSTGPC